MYSKAVLMVRCSCSEWRRADSLLAKFNVSLICVISRFGEAPSPHSFGDEIKFSTDKLREVHHA